MNAFDFASQEIICTAKTIRLTISVFLDRWNIRLSMKAVRNAEQGKRTLITYIKILRALNALDNLELFIPQTRVSPLQLAKMAGHKRQRASSKRT